LYVPLCLILDLLGLAVSFQLSAASRRVRLTHHNAIAMSETSAMLRKTHPAFLCLGSPGRIGKGSSLLALLHPGGLEIVVEDIRVNIGAIIPGNGPPLNSHGLKHFGTAADRLKNGSVQERLQVDFPLGVIIKGNQYPEALEQLNAAHPDKGA
jgi:hypothetical protein